MAGKLEFTLQEYKDAARKWRSDFLRLPIIGCDVYDWSTWYKIQGKCRHA